MESGGRTPEERRAAAEARARGAEDARARESATRGMGARHYGGPAVYLRRRLIAGAAVIVLIIAIFLLVGGC